jgi:hypothetical protein
MSFYFPKYNSDQNQSSKPMSYFTKNIIPALFIIIGINPLVFGKEKSKVTKEVTNNKASSEFKQNADIQSTLQNINFSKNQFLIAQTEDELFDTMDSDSSLSDSESSTSDPFTEFNETTDNNSNSENADLDSFLSDSEEMPLADPEISEPFSSEISSSKRSQPVKKDELEDSQITKDVQQLQGANVKTSKSKKIKFIKHPSQKEGLYKISADGRYYYKVEQSKQKYGLGIKGGALILNQLENLKASPNIKFNDIYGSSAKPSFYVEYYWAYFKNKNVPQILKKARVKMGSGLLMATGNGRFANSAYEGVASKESYTFLAFPNHLGLHLSFEVTGKQLIVPFVTGAFEYLVGLELQNGNFARTKVLGQLGAHVGGGLALSLGWLDQMAQFDLDSEFGINQTYFTVELRQNIALQSDFNFTATFINAGIQLEF